MTRREYHATPGSGDRRRVVAVAARKPPGLASCGIAGEERPLAWQTTGERCPEDGPWVDPGWTPDGSQWLPMGRNGWCNIPILKPFM